MRRLVHHAAVAACTGWLAMACIDAADAQQTQDERGKYLVSIAGCNDCHTPGYFFGKPDMNRYLGGSEVGFEIPGLGVFHGPNLTPDPETGLGKWSIAEIVTALQTGKRPDGRELAPIIRSS
jgi:mono/diheme cytochrome c family protein